LISFDCFSNGGAELLTALLTGVAVVAALYLLCAILLGYARAPKGWHASENGNPTLLINGSRVTVFESDGGWKFCIATPTDGDDDPYFSDPYAHAEHAKHEALALIGQRSSKYPTLRSARMAHREWSQAQWLADQEDIERSLREELTAAMANPAINITKLRPIEARITTRARYVGRLPDSFPTGSDEHQRACATAAKLDDLLATVESKIAELKARKAERRPAPTPPSASGR
jgi:hypothetical protein